MLGICMNMLGICKESVWNKHGTRIAYASSMLGICMDMLGMCKECAWNMHIIRIPYAWNMHEHAWSMQGLCLEYAWNTHRICLEYAWSCLEYARNHGIRIEYAWNMLNIVELAVWEVRVQRDLKHVLLDGTLRRCWNLCKLPCRHTPPWNKQEGLSKKVAKIQIPIPVQIW